jgi:hypothetical protein
MARKEKKKRSGREKISQSQLQAYRARQEAVLSREEVERRREEDRRRQLRREEQMAAEAENQARRGRRRPEALARADRGGLRECQSGTLSNRALGQSDVCVTRSDRVLHELDRQSPFVENCMCNLHEEARHVSSGLLRLQCYRGYERTIGVSSSSSSLLSPTTSSGSSASSSSDSSSIDSSESVSSVSSSSSGSSSSK